jgi:hypothetical protein
MARNYRSRRNARRGASQRQVYRRRLRFEPLEERRRMNAGQRFQQNCPSGRAAVWNVALGNIRNRIRKIGRLARLRNEHQTFHQRSHRLAGTGDENSRRMTPACQMVAQMARDCVSILREQQPIFAFRPLQNCRIVAGERQVGRVAHARHVEQQLATQILPQDRLPQRTAQMLVEHKSQRHALSHLRCRCRRFLSGQAPAEGIEVQPPGPFLAVVHRRRVGRHVGIDFRLVVQVERQRLMHQREGQTRIVRGEHLRRLAFVVTLNQVIQADAMTRQADFALWRFSEEWRKLHEIPLVKPHLHSTSRPTHGQQRPSGTAAKHP